jgi:hypothetical protein
LARFGAFWRVLARFGAFWRVMTRFWQKTIYTLTSSTRVS